MDQESLAGVRAVLFDAVGTLIHAAPSVESAYRRVGLAHGVDLPEAEIRTRFRRAFARQEQLDAADAQGRTSTERELRRWREIVAEVFPEAKGESSERLFDALWEHFGQASAWRVDTDADRVWRGLTRAGLTIGVASNFDDRLELLARRLPPLDRASRVFISSRLGFRKPAAGFFAAIEAQLGLPPREILLVGDHLENDYRAARARGWQALLVSETPSTEVAAIRGLHELEVLWLP